MPRVNKFRYDPYKNFPFYLKWNDRYVAGVTKVSGLEYSPKAVPRRSAHTPRQRPDGSIILERGITDDLEFQQWVRSGSPAQDFRKDIVLEVRNEAGQLVVAYNIHRAWVSKIMFLPDPNDSTGEVAIELIELQNEGWERDDSMAEPGGPTFILPGS